MPHYIMHETELYILLGREHWVCLTTTEDAQLPVLKQVAHHLRTVRIGVRFAGEVLNPHLVREEVELLLNLLRELVVRLHHPWVIRVTDRALILIRNARCELVIIFTLAEQARGTKLPRGRAVARTH